MRATASFLLAFACLSTLSSPVASMVQPKSGAEAGLKSVQAIIIHEDSSEYEHLLLTATIDVTGAERLGWIVPIPSKSARVRVVFPEAFATMKAAADVGRTESIKAPRRGAPRATSQGARDPSVARVRLDVHTFDAAGAQAREALEAWLTQRGLDPPPSETLSYYAERGWTYVAVDLTPAHGEKTIAPGVLPGLGISFRSKYPIFPINALRGHGDIDVTVYTMTKSPLRKPDVAGAAKLGFEAVGNTFLGYVPAAKSKKKRPLLSKLEKFVTKRGVGKLRDAMYLSGLSDEDEFALRILVAESLHTDRIPKTEDLRMPPLPDGERLEGDFEAEPPKIGGGVDKETSSIEPDISLEEQLAAQLGDMGSPPKEQTFSVPPKRGMCSSSPSGHVPEPLGLLLLAAVACLGRFRRSRYDRF